MAHGFDRKIFNARIFFSDLGFLLRHLPSAVGAMRNPELGKAFIEKTMMVVTGVNGCTYCTWFHAKEAVKSGLSEDEILDFCKEKIAHFKIPKHIWFVDDFPMTVTGKLQKFRMRDIAIERLAKTGSDRRKRL